MEEVKLPNEDCSLFVPSAIMGGIPAFNKTGSVINPPPPATESTQPAIIPADRKMVMCKVGFSKNKFSILLIFHTIK